MPYEWVIFLTYLFMLSELQDLPLKQIRNAFQPRYLTLEERS